MDELQHCHLLEHVDLRHRSSLESLPSLEECSSLRSVWLHGTGLRLEDLSPWVGERATWRPNPFSDVEFV